MVFVVWYTGEQDGFVRDETGRLRAAKTIEAIAAIPEIKNLQTKNSVPTEYDFDQIQAWCADPDMDKINCSAFIDAWNFFDDLSKPSSRSKTTYVIPSSISVNCYDKLFWGSNLASTTPPGERFEPDWQDTELDEICRTLNNGLKKFKSELIDSL